MESNEITIHRCNTIIAGLGFCAGIAWILFVPMAYVIFSNDPIIWYALVNFAIGIMVICAPLLLLKTTFVWRLVPEGIHENVRSVFDRIRRKPGQERIIPWKGMTAFQKGELALPYGNTFPCLTLFADNKKVFSLIAAHTRHRDDFARFAAQLEERARAYGLTERPASRGWLRSALGRFVSLSLLLLTSYLIWLDWTNDTPAAWTSKLHLYVLLVPYVLWMNIRSFR